jgi:hypothetical protein
MTGTVIKSGECNQPPKPRLDLAEVSGLVLVDGLIRTKSLNWLLL